MCTLGVCLVAAVAAAQENLSALPTAPAPNGQTATVTGTVLDTNGGVVPGATVVLKPEASGDVQALTASDNGAFTFEGVREGTYRVVVSGQGFAAWSSDDFTLSPGQYFILKGAELKVETVVTTVAALTSEQIATEEVHNEEKQRAFGFAPNFYVAFEPTPAPLTSRLKFQLALRTLGDPVTLAGFVGNAAIYQASRYPDYQEGWAGYGQRLGSTFAGGYTNVLVGAAALPSLLHQDPRYFYRGTGTTRSRVMHALAYPVLTRGDNGRTEFNYSSIGGDLASGAIANAYYPQRDRGPRLVLDSALIGAGGRVANGLAQEFLLHRFTSHAQ